jgi:hypothetical protein
MEHIQTLRFDPRQIAGAPASATKPLVIEPRIDAGLSSGPAGIGC